MIRRIIYISIFALLLQTNVVSAGTTGSEELKGSGSQDTASECFEGFSRAMFKLNHGLDKVIFEPVAKGYRALPVPIRKGTGNVVDNLRSLLTFSNNILQGEFGRAGNNAARFGINSTAGILGIFDPASKLGFEDQGEKFPWKQLSKKNIGIWHSFKPNLLRKFRRIGISSKKDKIKFVKNLKKIGYCFSTNNKYFFVKIVKAFQRHYRQEVINGLLDKECLIIAENLSKKP